MQSNWQPHRLLLLLCIITVAGCATNQVQSYVAHDKVAPAANEVAYLHVSEKIMVDEIDGRGRHYPLIEPFGRRYRGAVIELLPGTHTANVIYHERYGYTSRITAVPLNLEAGRHYEIRASFTQVNYSPKIAFEVVVRSDADLDANQQSR